MVTRVGVIGCGIGAAWVRAFIAQPDCQVVSLGHKADLRAPALAEKYAIPHVFDGHTALLEKGPLLDICVVATPPATHRAIACAAMERGISVLVEKPPATNYGDAMAMYLRSLATDTFLGWSWVYRLAQGKPPARPYLSAAHATWHRQSGPSAAWAFDPAQAGGGVLADCGVHILDLCWALLGTPAMTAVQGTMQDEGGQTIMSGCETTFQGVVTCGRQRISLDLAWNAPDDVQRIDFFGDAAQTPPHTAKIEDSFSPVVDDGIFERAAGEFIRTLYTSNRARQMQLTGEGVEIQKTLDALYLSAAKGHGVKLA